MNRRCFLAGTLGVFAASAAARRRPAAEVVLYSSVDDYLLKDVIRAFEAGSGISVKLVGDTEATKTTGLVQRLLAERANPRADVWWSSEPFGTIRLAEEGLLEPFTSTSEAAFAGSWPAGLRPADRLWYGFAPRARVIARNTDRLDAAGAPTRLRDLADPKWRGRVGMARPEFGTTRGHMAALLHLCGEESFAHWLRAMKANAVRLYDGNAAVVRALRFAEIDLGLTDTDDVYAAQRQGWPVALAFEPRDEAPPPALCSPGPIAIPNTVARVKGGPNPDAAGTLIDFILSERVERLLASSDSRNAPVRESVRRDFPDLALPPGPALDYAAVAARIDRAMALCREILG